MPKKKKSEDSAAKIKKRVAAMVKERPSHKEILEFYKDVVTEQNAIKSKVKISPLDIDEENFKNKIIDGFSLVEKGALTMDIPAATRLFKRLCKILSSSKTASHDAERITKALRNKEIDLFELFKHAEMRLPGGYQ